MSKVNIQELALSFYDNMMYIFSYYWKDVKECSDKKRAYIRVKTHAIIGYDRILINGSKMK